MTNKTSPYRQRAIRQGWDWVSGISKHNEVDDECCPDFSCCYPNLLTRSKDERLKYMLKQVSRWIDEEILHVSHIAQ